MIQNLTATKEQHRTVDQSHRHTMEENQGYNQGKVILEILLEFSPTPCAPTPLSSIGKHSCCAWNAASRRDSHREIGNLEREQESDAEASHLEQNYTQTST